MLTLCVMTMLHSDQIPSNLFFKYNADLGPPYNVLVDTNFINFSIKNKLEVVSAMMDCLLAKCTPWSFRSCVLCIHKLLTWMLYPLVGVPCITDCVMAELEKLGHKYRVALRSVLSALHIACASRV